MRRREREWRGRHLSTCILDRHLCLYSQGDLKTQFNIDSTALKESGVLGIIEVIKNIFSVKVIYK